jgi:hypothetical protein
MASQTAQYPDDAPLSTLRLSTLGHASRLVWQQRLNGLPLKRGQFVARHNEASLRSLNHLSADLPTVYEYVTERAFKPGNQNVEETTMRSAGEAIAAIAYPSLFVLTALAAIGAVAAGVTTFNPSQAKANAAIAQKTSKPCGTCHTKAPELNGTGKKYKATGKL